MKLGFWKGWGKPFGIGVGSTGGGASDTTAPTVTITSTETSPSAANPIPLTFTLSEASTTFAVGDITVGAGGSIGNFAGSGTSYTADLTVTTAGATITVDVAADSFTDEAGNGNTAATQFSITGLHLKDTFTTADDSPITTPHTCEPGPGTLTVVQTDGTFAIATGKLAFTAQSTPAWGDLSARSGAIARAAGRCLFGNIKITTYSNFSFGWANSTTPDTPSTWFDLGFDVSNSTTAFSSRYVNAQSTLGLTIANGTEYQYALSVLATGGYMFIKGGAYTEWTLIWVANTRNTATLYAAINNFASAGTVDNLRVADLGAPFVADYGLATNRVASPSVGETTTATANAIVELTWTAVTGQALNLYVRRTDDTHTWSIRLDQTGGTYKIIEINGTETERASGSITLTNGVPYRVVAILSGDQISAFVADSAGISYASASYNNTATGVKTDRAGANLITWPRTLAGAALTEMNRVTSP